MRNKTKTNFHGQWVHGTTVWNSSFSIAKMTEIHENFAFSNEMSLTQSVVSHVSLHINN